MPWAEGSLWVGQYRERKIHHVDPVTGRVLRTIESNRFVTGVTWVDGALWHGTWESDESELRRIDPETGAVRHREAAGRRRLGPGVGQRRSPLLRRRAQREGEGSEESEENPPGENSAAA